MELAGNVAIVTGGTKGIGKAIAEAFVKAGVNVAMCSRSEDELHKAVSELNGLDQDRRRVLFATSEITMT